MTEAEFDAKLVVWANRVKSMASGVLSTKTHSSGQLNQSLARFVDKMRDNVGRHIAYRFEQYGVFRHYGAGKGWVIINGVPTPGRRVVSLKSLRNHNWRNTSEVRALVRQGHKLKDIRNAKRSYADSKSSNPRTPLDWLDGNITRNFAQLADIAQEYFGDVALRSLDKQISKAKIVK